jgi:hypothetical protein
LLFIVIHCYSLLFIVIHCYSLLFIVLCRHISRKPAPNEPARANPIVFLLILAMAERWNAPLP